MPDFLLLMDIPSIKKYVFMTHKLKEVQGASIIIDDLNRIDFKKKLTEYLPEKNIELVYANGGSAQFIIYAADNLSLQAAMVKVTRHVMLTTDGSASMVWGFSELREDYQGAVKEAQMDLLNHRDQDYFTVASMHIPFSRECDSCSRGLTVCADRDGDWLCPVCAAKRKARDNRRSAIWQEFNKFLIQAGLIKNTDQIKRPNDFTEIGASCKGDYIAIVYADGNSMGRFIKEIDTKDRFKDFANIIDGAIKQSCFKALAKVCKGELSNHKIKKSPADILMVGGDDLLVALPADKALTFAALAGKYFKAETAEQFAQPGNTFFKEKFAGKGCTISLGIAMGKTHHPFRLLLSQAEELLQRAKKAGSKDPDAKDFWVPSYMDFHIATQSHQLRIEHIRRKDYSFKSIVKNSNEKFHRTFRPYRIDGITNLFNAAAELKNIDFPKTKLSALYRAALGYRTQAMLETMRIITRCPKHERDALIGVLDNFGCKHAMPWSAENRTFLTELVEFYDFIRADPGNDGEDHHDYV